MPREVSLNLNDHGALLLDMYLDEMRSRIILDAALISQNRIGSEDISVSDVTDSIANHSQLDRSFLDNFVKHVDHVYKANKPNTEGRVAATPGAVTQE